MARTKRRIRDRVRPKEDYPAIAERVDRGGWCPEILCDVNGAYWNTRAVRDRHGKRNPFISDGESRHMIQLILDGAFGEEAKDAFIDGDHYQKIYDNLYEWPNQEVIARDGLRMLAVARKR